MFLSRIINVLKRFRIDKEKLEQRIARWLIKFRRVKSVSMTADEINELLSENLPETFEIPVPGCKGELIIQSAQVRMPALSDHFQVTLHCALHVESMGNPIYRAHVNISGSAWPAYDHANKRIYLNNIKVQEIKLIQDEYALLRDTKHIMSMFVPGPIRSVLGATLKTTLNVLSAATLRDTRSYLSIYVSGNKQKVLDYHKPELEKVVKQINDDGDLSYELDETIFEEQLFAEFGKDVRVKDSELQFIFHR